jgi:quercetin dioxygenase-like cupin family protein
VTHVPDAPLRSTKFGLVADVDGWFVVNARAARWRDYGPLGVSCNFEGKRPFKQLGFNVNVLQPGEPLGLYHREARQEAFLVVAGECLLVVEGEERRLRTWDFFHCPPGTPHVIVGAGSGPSVVVAVGARGGRKGLRYLADATARAYDAAVAEETADFHEAYARFPRSARIAYRDGWLP